MCDETEHNYHYLTKMPLDSVTEENVQKLLKDHKDKQDDLHMVESMSIQTMWNNELNQLSQEYEAHRRGRGEPTKAASGVSKSKPKVQIIKKKIIVKG